ncbi:hypothetical protein [Nocardia sp. NPDC004860]|uniref:hypothetical protein n=1 Tax=Nocardia sp. NPDC004860 TaxID=3154557 RepID=UPI0033A16D45
MEKHDHRVHLGDDQDDQRSDNSIADLSKTAMVAAILVIQLRARDAVERCCQRGDCPARPLFPEVDRLREITQVDPGRLDRESALECRRQRGGYLLVEIPCVTVPLNAAITDRNEDPVVAVSLEPILGIL